MLSVTFFSRSMEPRKEKLECTPGPAGYVYVLSNAAMNTSAGEPILKIGKSKRGGSLQSKRRGQGDLPG